jgi:hypothetical protein
MKCILFLISFTFFTLYSSVTAQVTNFKVNGVGIASTYSVVVKKLGKPLSSKKGGIVPCSEGSTLLTLRYKGLEIWLSKDEAEKSFSVFAIWLTSSKWSVSGINIGSTVKSVKTKFGQPYHQTRDGLLGLHYNNNRGVSGAASFYFRGNRLKKADMYLNYC